MTDILIRHCKVRIVRRGGWSWGPAPHKLAEDTARLVSNLLAKKLEEMWPGEENLEIVEPIKINIPLHFNVHDLHSMALQDQSGESISSDLKEHVAQALDKALVTVALKAPLSETGVNEEFSSINHYSEDFSKAYETSSKEAVFRLLQLWREQGTLGLHLASFSSEALEAFYEHLVNRSHETSHFFGNKIADIEAFFTKIIDQELPPRWDRSARLNLRLLAIMEATAHFSLPPNDPGLLAALDERIPLPKKELSEPRVLPSKEHSQHPVSRDEPLANDSSVSTENQRAAETHSFQRSPHVSFYSSPRQFECRIEQALPFLLLSPLSRIGYWDALAAVLEASNLLLQASQFATAMAYKVLAPPKHGWLRSPSEMFSAAAFAGLVEPLPGSELVRFDSLFTPFLSPLNSTLKESLIAGHDSSKPILIKRTREGGFLLVDAEGIFPITWPKTVADLVAIASRCNSILLVPSDSVGNSLFSELDAAGLRFITNVPPIRNENWRSLKHTSSMRYWTNDWSLSEARLFNLAYLFPDTVEKTDELWQALLVDRPAATQTVNSVFDRSLTVAVSAALGTIAWILWRERESVTPVLALERFRDFGAHVRFDHEIVQVKFPLGKRFWDLRSHGLLTDLTDVPWLLGRTLQFTGG